MPVETEVRNDFLVCAIDRNAEYCKMRRFSFVDLFSGAGGMSFGFKQHPAFYPLFGVDAQLGKPSSPRGSLECNKSYEANIGIPVHEADLSQYEPEDLMRDAGLRPRQLDVLISCAPCTGFSRTLRKNHLEDDPRNSLVGRTGKFVEVLKPSILVMENARELVKGNFSHHCDNLQSHLKDIGYSFHAQVHMLSDFGLPQVRERAIVIARRDSGAIHGLDDLWKGYSVSQESITVRRAIGDLPPVTAGQSHPDDPAHVSPKFSNEITYLRLKALPHNGGSWYDLLDHPDADRLLIPSMKRAAARGDFGSHPDVYGRLWWDRPCVTIKRECAHVGNGRYSHPEQDRMCTVREIALMSGFPRTYQLNGQSLSNKYRHVGDAVPPLISFQLAWVCNWMLTDRKPVLASCILAGTSLRACDIVEKRGQKQLFG
jgi:DNA (cytosine-5)-methyltransferase 1